jgi:hypothetical protein
MFVDDLLLFGNGSAKEAKSFAHILDLFCHVIGMEINKSKSFITHVTHIQKEMISKFLPFSLEDLNQNSSIWNSN